MTHSGQQCPYCESSMRISKLTCQDCGLALEGDFPTPRLYRLSKEEQHFVELMVLASGSLKEMANLLDISYPTVRSRLDRLIARLKAERTRDAKHKEKILEEIEAGHIPAKRGLRLIENL